MSTAANRVGVQKAEWIQTATEDHFRNPRLKVFITVHEFEALLFAGPEELASTLASRDHGQVFRAIRDGFETPEHINEGPDTHPAKRIAKLSSTYQKPVHGVQAAERIGLARIRTECRHFDRWLTMLEGLARPPLLN